MPISVLVRNQIGHIVELPLGEWIRIDPPGVLARREFPWGQQAAPQSLNELVRVQVEADEHEFLSAVAVDRMPGPFDVGALIGIVGHSPDTATEMPAMVSGMCSPLSSATQPGRSP